MVVVVAAVAAVVVVVVVVVACHAYNTLAIFVTVFTYSFKGARTAPWQMLLPPQSLHLERSRPCSQMTPPPLFLQ